MFVLKRSVWRLSENGRILRPLHLAHSHYLWHQHRLHSFWWVSVSAADCAVVMFAPAKPHSVFCHSLNPSFLAWSSGCHPGCRAVPGDLLGSCAGSVWPVVGAGWRCQGPAAAHLPPAPNIFCGYSHLLWYIRVCMRDQLIWASLYGTGTSDKQIAPNHPWLLT